MVLIQLFYTSPNSCNTSKRLLFINWWMDGEKIHHLLHCSVQSLSRVWLFATPWTTAHQASLSITNSQSLPKLMSIETVMAPIHLILCRPVILLPSIPPSIRVFSNESALHVRWPKYRSFSFDISPSNEHPGLISYRMDWLDLHCYLFLIRLPLPTQGCGKLVPYVTNLRLNQDSFLRDQEVEFHLVLACDKPKVDHSSQLGQTPRSVILLISPSTEALDSSYSFPGPVYCCSLFSFVWKDKHSIFFFYILYIAMG